MARKASLSVHDIIRIVEAKEVARDSVNNDSSRHILLQESGETGARQQAAAAPPISQPADQATPEEVKMQMR